MEPIRCSLPPSARRRWAEEERWSVYDGVAESVWVSLTRLGGGAMSGEEGRGRNGHCRKQEESVDRS